MYYKLRTNGCVIKHNLLIKELTTKTNGRNYLRLAIRNEADNDLLIDAMKKELDIMDHFV